MNEKYENSAVSFPKVAILGTGSMGGAILSGLRAPEVAVERPILITTRSQESAAAFEGAADVSAVAAESDPEANRRAIAGAGVVILGVKPWMIHDLLREIADALEPGTIVVSVAAGVTTESMEALVPAGIPVVRAMPNTPSYVGRGVTGVAGGSSADAAAVTLVQRLFETVGDVVVVDESQINAVAAVSGSGPAYLYLFAEELAAAAQRLGFSEADARLLAENTIIGAAELMRTSDETPTQLRRNVTSPKGTTEQAIMVLQESGLGGILDRALAANVRRSEELEAGAK